MQSMVRNCLMSLAILLGAALPANAEEPRMTQGVFCETIEQAEAFLNAFDGKNVKEALKAANGELTSEQGCGTARLVVVQVETFHEVKNDAGTWMLTKVMALGVATPYGVRPLPIPRVQYTAFQVGAAPVRHEI